jgi:hypothetical protein
MAKKIALDHLRRISRSRASTKPDDAPKGSERRIVADLPKPEGAD